MTMTVNAWAAPAAKQALGPTTIERRDVGPHDILIEIKASGICHSDIHQAREEWGGSIFPMVPGHEIVGVVTEVGSAVTKFKLGDRAGVGCFVDSCRECEQCAEGDEQYCENGPIVTYNGKEKDGKTPTYGGYSTHIVVDENYGLHVPENLPFTEAAPLLCAGITLYSPLRHWGAGPGTRVGIIGLGGLGHMGVKLAHAMGAHVTVLSHSPSKEEDAKRLGADEFVNTNSRAQMRERRKSFDLIINSVSADIDLNQYLNLLKKDGSLVLVGLPENPMSIAAFGLTGARRSIAGSQIGGIAETQEMLDFCSEHDIVSEVEVIPAAKINEAWDRVVASDVRYRFVIDATTFE